MAATHDDDTDNSGQTPFVTNSTHIAIVTPVYNDWLSCARLISELDAVAAEIDGATIDILIVDDGSSGGAQTQLVDADGCHNINRISVIQLASNMGHQRAIAAGLFAAVEAGRYESIVIMDSDGEDQPCDVIKLVEQQRISNGQAIVAKRAKRSEGPIFRASYYLYKGVFRLLTGTEISFGNFSILSREAATRLLHMPELWNNYPSALLRSRLLYSEIETERGERYAGTSKMNFSNLVIHGLNAISVNSEIVFIRVMFICVAIGLTGILGALAVTALRLFTDLAVPGWASDVIGNIAVIFTQALFFFFISMFLLLHSRSNPALTPRTVIPGYIASRYDILSHGKPGI